MSSAHRPISQPVSPHAARSVEETAQSRAERNRANARHSTGPRTPEGKARSRANAVTHGLYARVLTPTIAALGEDAADVKALHESLVAEYAPEGPHEERLVARLALLWWRLDRLSTHAQQGLADAIAAGAGTVDALLGSEKTAVAEARLERAIARLHRDLLFLARYRKRAREADAKRPIHQRLADLEALSAAGVQVMEEAADTESATEQRAPQVDTQLEPHGVVGDAQPLADSSDQTLAKTAA